MVLNGDNGTWFREDDFSAKASSDGEGSILVSLAGELDLSTAPDVRNCLTAAQVLQAQDVHVDLTKVTYIDSSNVGLLVAACKRTRNAGGAFSVRCDEGGVLRVLEISGLLEYLQVRDAAGVPPELLR